MGVCLLGAALDQAREDGGLFHLVMGFDDATVFAKFMTMTEAPATRNALRPPAYCIAALWQPTRHVA